MAGLPKALAERRPVYWFDSTPSTMTEAARLVEQGAPSGTVVGADVQSAGQGRHGRHWESEPGGLYVSLILRLALKPEDVPVVTLALGLAAADAIEKCAGVSCDLRWPNDVMLKGKKCAGILTQLHEGAVIAGMGINLAQRRFPSELESIATSVLLASGREVSRDALLEALVDSVDVHTGILIDEGKQRILDMVSHASSYVRGRRVIVDQGGHSDEGTTEGLNEHGFLWLRTTAGQRKLILAGGVRPAP
jgi:BirA family transcriptional regulator, biotin operon repressor / biotin---[acetyl-CoA-carboxylase] ligase